MLDLFITDSTLNVIHSITHELWWGLQREPHDILLLDLTFFSKMCLVTKLASQTLPGDKVSIFSKHHLGDCIQPSKTNLSQIMVKPLKLISVFHPFQPFSACFNLQHVSAFSSCKIFQPGWQHPWSFKDWKGLPQPRLQFIHWFGMTQNAAASVQEFPASVKE